MTVWVKITERRALHQVHVYDRMGEDYRKKSVTSGACVWAKITERIALHQVHVYDRMGEDYRKNSVTSGACV